MTRERRGSAAPSAGIIFLLLLLRLHPAVGQDTADDTLGVANLPYPWEASITTTTTSVTTATTTAATTSETTTVTTPPTTKPTTATTAATTTASPASRSTSTAPTTASTTAKTTTVTPTALITDENTALTDDGNIGRTTATATKTSTRGSTTTTTGGTTATATQTSTRGSTTTTTGGTTATATQTSTRGSTTTTTGGTTATSSTETTTVSEEGSVSVLGMTDWQIVLVVLGGLGIGAVLTGLLFLLGSGSLSGLFGGFSGGFFDPAAASSGNAAVGNATAGNATAGRTANTVRYNNPYNASDRRLHGRQEPPQCHGREHHHDNTRDCGGRSSHFYP